MESTSPTTSPLPEPPQRLRGRVVVDPQVLRNRVEGAATLTQGGKPERDRRRQRRQPGEWRLGVDHPLGLAGGSEVLGEAPGVGEGLQPAGEAQAAGLEGVLQRREEDAAEVA